MSGLTPVKIQNDYDAEKGQILSLRVLFTSNPHLVVIKNFLETFKGEPEKDLAYSIAGINIAADDAPGAPAIAEKYKRQLVRTSILCLARL